MKRNNTNTGKYINKISQKATSIEAKGKSRKVRRFIFLGIILIVCAGGIIFGISEKNNTIETQYQRYLEEPDQSALSNELLSYKDVSDLFITSFLGNHPSQSLMGGYYFCGTNCSVYPDQNCERMLLCIDNKETEICKGLASDINVKDGFVYYRKLNTRTISRYSISEGKSANLPLSDVGQFVVWNNKLAYVDLSSSALMEYDLESSESKELIPSGVSSFAIIGRYVVYLSSEHTLYEMDLSDGSQTVLGKNISTFSYDSLLWLQNNDKVYSKSLDDKAITERATDLLCNRLLGVSGTYLFIESDDGIYLFDTANESNRKIADGIFVGAKDTEIIVFIPERDAYQVIEVG